MRVLGQVDGIPSWVGATVRKADLVIRAGDFDSPATLNHLRDLSARFVGVSGSINPPGIDLPFVEVVRVNGLKFVVTRGTGTRAGCGPRVAKTIRDAADVGAVDVTGHIREVVDEVVDGVRVLDSGTATAANPGDDATVMVGTVTDDSASVEVVRND